MSEQIYVVYTTISPDWIPARHKDIYYERSDSSVVYMRGYPGSDDNLATSVQVFQPGSSQLELIRSWELGREIIAVGDDLSSEANAMISELIRINGENIPYVNDDTNSNWAADKALLAAGLTLPTDDNFGEFWSPGSIDQNKIDTRGSDDYRGGDGEWCFLGDTSIRMWPLDPSIKPRADDTYDEQLVLSKVWEKPISEIRVGDLVVSHDDKGRIKPGPVTRTMTNTATHLLDFWSTGVTPGHAYYCADGKFKDQHVPLMDILRTDGAIMRADGTMIRAATGCEVGSLDDRVITAIVGDKTPGGLSEVRQVGQIRLGTRFILADGRDICVADLIKAGGGAVTDDGLILVGDARIPFRWTLADRLPKPEDYILQRSNVTLADIYAANEWEEIGPQLPDPRGSEPDAEGEVRDIRLN